MCLEPECRRWRRTDRKMCCRYFMMMHEEDIPGLHIGLKRPDGCKRSVLARLPGCRHCGGPQQQLQLQAQRRVVLYCALQREQQPFPPLHALRQAVHRPVCRRRPQRLRTGFTTSAHGHRTQTSQSTPSFASAPACPGLDKRLCHHSASGNPDSVAFRGQPPTAYA